MVRSFDDFAISDLLGDEVPDLAPPPPVRYVLAPAEPFTADGPIDVQRWAFARQARPTIEMRRTAADRAVPRHIKTRKLLGDPRPGRTPWAAAEDAEERERQARLDRLRRAFAGHRGPAPGP
ncbi:MAG: hypothetical protein JWP92_1801 [Caulobacter sp.]|nr:hypothetical protein [Caulobacter sp.]